VAAEYAAAFGAKVLVIDKKREIGSPVRCAEGLGFPSFKLLGLDTSSDFVFVPPFGKEARNQCTL
jgi:digeranylgeranylglycerophospholipid reductase